MPNRFMSFSILASLIALSYGSAAQAQPNASAQTKRPNVLIILADDVGYMDFGAYGGEAATPAIDAVAARGIKTFLCGMLAPVNLGPEYGAEFNPVYPDLAQKYGLAFYPFFLQDVALVPRYNQRDGLHPNAEGVAKIIDGMMPLLQKFLSEK